MRLVFFKRGFEWPIRAGATVHSGNLMRSLVHRGHEVELWTEGPIPGGAAEWLNGISIRQIEPTSNDSEKLPRATRWFSEFWGNDRPMLFGLREAVSVENPDALVFVGPDMLPAASLVPGVPSVWYVADDPVLHQVSLGLNGKRLVAAARMVAYELSLHGAVDATWVVSERDRRWSRLLRGRNVTWLPNGVDTDHYAPRCACEIPKTCVFWGNLGFRPNEDAIQFWLDRVWPAIMAVEPTARFWVCGCSPSNSLRSKIDQAAGVEFMEDLSDLRPQICQAEVTVFPLVSGAGVKNKVLEAAALGKTIVCSPRCRYGLAGTELPLKVCRSPDQWKENLVTLWHNSELRRELGANARSWVEHHHRWAHSAALAEASLRAIVSQS